MIIIGVDGGGTTTRAAAVRFSGGEPEVLATGRAASSNFYSVGIEAAARQIKDAAQEALSTAKVALEDVEAWGLGLAGACGPQEQELWRNQLLSFLHGARLVIDEDVVAAHRGAFAFPSDEERVGVLCIAGTGSNSFGIGTHGQRARADGYGPLLGDRGSGYSIGEAALRTACAAYDGSAPATALLDRVLDHFGVSSVDALIPIVYAPNFTKDKIAELVPTVLRCAEEKDEVAREILNIAGQQLATTCGAVMRKLATQRVAPYGGLLQNETPVRSAFVQHLQSYFAHLEICKPRYDAILGAALLAQDSL